MATHLLGVEYATVQGWYTAERNTLDPEGAILHLPAGTTTLIAKIQFRYGSAAMTITCAPGAECVGDVRAVTLPSIAVLDVGGFDLDFRDDNLKFLDVYVRNFDFTSTGDTYNELTFERSVAEGYFDIVNSANNINFIDSVAVQRPGDANGNADKVIDLQGAVGITALRSSFINAAGGVSAASAAVLSRTTGASSYNQCVIHSPTNPAFLLSSGTAPTNSANNAASDATFNAYGALSSAVTSDDFMDFDAGDYRLKSESVPALLGGGIGAFIQPIINENPVLDTPLGNLSFVEGSVGFVDLDGNFSDANIGDTLTFSDPVPELPSGYTFDNSNARVARDGSQVIAAQATFTITASDGHGGTDAVGTFTLTTTAIVPALNSIDTDNVIQAGQTGIAIATAGLPAAQPAGLVIQLSGRDLGLESWNSGQPTVTVGTHINLPWWAENLQLSMNYVGLVDGPITLDNVTMLGIPGWIEATFNGIAPVPDGESGTESFHEKAQLDPEVGEYEMLEGDIVVLEQIGDVTVDEQTIVTKSSGTSTGYYKIWRAAIGAFTGVSTYTFTDEGVPDAINQGPVVTAPADDSIEFANGSGGLAKNDPALVALLATASVFDDVDTLTVSADLSGFADPIPAGTITVQFNSTADAGGLIGSDTMQLVISEAAAANNPPTFTNSAPTVATVGNLYSFAPSTNDIDGDTVTLTSITLPSWLTLAGGFLSGTPAESDIGTHSVTLSGNDGNVSTPLSFNVVVSAQGFSYPEDRVFKFASTLMPSLVVGDTFRGRGTFWAGVPNAVYGVGSASSISAAIISADHTQRYCDPVVQSVSAVGSDWDNGIIVVSLPKDIAAQISAHIKKKETAKVEIQVTIDGEDYTWFSPVQLIPGHI